jgi:hypothetical protein
VSETTFLFLGTDRFIYFYFENFEVISPSRQSQGLKRKRNDLEPKKLVFVNIRDDLEATLLVASWRRSTLGDTA